MTSVLADQTFDFIVVGAGPAGCTLASRLANSRMSPRVLLVEAGADNKELPLEQLMMKNRTATFVDYPEFNWGYKTSPQPQLNGRQIDYSRGKGVGGSSINNFAFWTLGPRDDWDEWAHIVGDESFRWAHIERYLKHIENYHVRPPSKYSSPNMSIHGSNGFVDLGLPDTLEPETIDCLQTAELKGGLLNADINSGDPIGTGLVPLTGKRGIRVTARSALLNQIPPNLIVQANKQICRIMFSDKRTTGVEAIDGTIYKATQEVILAAGALDTPKLMMLSGVGNSNELLRHRIPVIHHLPGVGKNLQDHPFLASMYRRKVPPKLSYEAWTNEKAAAVARKQLVESGNGPYTVNTMSPIISFVKDNTAFSSKEFMDLPLRTQEYFLKPTTSTYEMAWGTSRPPMPGSDNGVFTTSHFLMHPQSTGTVQLASANPRDPPVCDPRILTHPFDRVSFLAAVKNSVKIAGNPAAATDSIEQFLKAPPLTDDDEELWSHIQDTVTTSWHMSCTVKMGSDSDPLSCVDSCFRVKGLEKLRVVDMSVAPFLPSCHTVSTAYLVGMIAAEKLMEEYRL